MNFAEMVDADIYNVFLNTEEFSENKDIKFRSKDEYKTIKVIWTDNTEKLKDEDGVVYLKEYLMSVKISDLQEEISENQKIYIDHKLYLITAFEEESGMYHITLTRGA
ncbi:hypothetical protein [Ilyobacter polytropus]|uniref:Phage head-tail adaptor n=1 Tax=Ilyobacter polytropus (strain ATCC 51220 / DSM 2926 / LMG 16218 / CuHBu1) TaxID=572544 RepID=E3HBM0_ILYPC|nr:hypothetical protein [Ilyobacter polytropus]ADO83716.1 conserved hypothetical protein [Ilyobacter polytropus DSM 2926]